MALLFSRQPIYDQNKKLYGYDLEYKINHSAPQDLSNDSTDLGGEADILVAGFTGMDFSQLASRRRIFFTLSEKMLMNEFATLFPKDNVVIQIKADVNVTQSVLDVCKSIHQAGYMLAIDDHFIRQGHEALAELSSFIKVDFNKMLESRESETQFSRLVNSRRRWVACKINSNEYFDHARQYPFSLYQGNFVSQPAVMSQKEIPKNHLSHLRLISAIESETPNFDEISRIIEGDPHLSYEILRNINSVYYYRGQKVRSIRQAAVLMGLTDLRKWAMVSTLRRFNQQDENGMINHCAQRAGLLERLGQKMGLGSKIHEFFTLGLLSMIDTLTQCPMEMVLTELAISDDMKDILLGNADQGDMAECFSLILAYEMGNWSKTNQISQKLNLKSESLSEAYYDSIVWSNGFELTK